MSQTQRLWNFLLLRSHKHSPYPPGLLSHIQISMFHLQDPSQQTTVWEPDFNTVILVILLVILTIRHIWETSQETSSSHPSLHITIIWGNFKKNTESQVHPDQFNLILLRWIFCKSSLDDSNVQPGLRTTDYTSPEPVKWVRGDLTDRGKPPIRLKGSLGYCPFQKICLRILFTWWTMPVKH